MKLLHVMGYAWLAFLWLLLRRPKQRAWHLACALLGFGILAECLQVFSAGREARLGDVIANAVGIGVGLGMGFIAVWVLGTLRLRRAAGETVQKRD
jgi:VanZ family protein